MNASAFRFSPPEPPARAPERVQLKIVGTDAWDSRQTESRRKTDSNQPPDMEELHQANQALETAGAEEILCWATRRFGKSLTMATAFGPEGMVIIHLLAEIAPDTPIFNLDTGYQFAETHQLRDQVIKRYGIEVELKQPDLSVEQYEQLHGGPVYLRRPDQCCYDRKVRVLQQAVQGKQAWISAIRRDQSPARAQAPIVGWDDKFQLAKVNPLANWTKSQVWKLIRDEGIPYNPLHDQGYPSIGCQPCTRPVQAGEDDRAGRWSSHSKTECGLHVLNNSQGWQSDAG